MNTNEIAIAIRTRFKTLIADIYSLPTQYDNQDFHHPANSLWARASVRFADSKTVSLKRGRKRGILFVQLFYPYGQGDAAPLAMADNIENKFHGVTAGGIVYRTPTSRPVGRSEKWWQVNVECPFYCDNVTS